MNDISLLAIMQKLVDSGGGGGGGQSDLPSVTNADNGKVLKVINGSWGKGNETPPSPEIDTFGYIHLFSVVTQISSRHGICYLSSSIDLKIYSSTGEIIKERQTATIDDLIDLYTNSEYKTYPILLTVAQASSDGNTIFNIFNCFINRTLSPTITKAEILAMIHQTEEPFIPVDGFIYTWTSADYDENYNVVTNHNKISIYFDDYNNNLEYRVNVINDMEYQEVL